MRYWDELLREQRGDLEIIVDKTWEDLDPKQCFEEEDLPELYEKINNGTYDWFMLRVRVLVEGLEVAEEFLGGCCYEDAREVLKDGTAEDMIHTAIEAAKPRFYKLSRVFGGLSAAVDNQTI